MGSVGLGGDEGGSRGFGRCGGKRRRRGGSVGGWGGSAWSRKNAVGWAWFVAWLWGSCSLSHESVVFRDVVINSDIFAIAASPFSITAGYLLMHDDTYFMMMINLSRYQKS